MMTEYTIEELRNLVKLELGLLKDIVDVASTLNDIKIEYSNKLYNMEIKKLLESPYSYYEKSYDEDDLTDEFAERVDKLSHMIGNDVAITTEGVFQSVAKLVDGQPIHEIYYGPEDIYSKVATKYVQIKKSIGFNDDENFFDGGDIEDNLSLFERHLVVNGLKSLYVRIRETIRDTNTDIKYITEQKHLPSITHGNDEISNAFVEAIRVLKNVYKLSEPKPDEKPTLNYYGSDRSNSITI